MPIQHKLTAFRLIYSHKYQPTVCHFSEGSQNLLQKLHWLKKVDLCSQYRNEIGVRVFVLNTLSWTWHELGVQYSPFRSSLRHNYEEVCLRYLSHFAQFTTCNKLRAFCCRTPPVRGRFPIKTTPIPAGDQLCVLPLASLRTPHCSVGMNEKRSRFSRLSSAP